VRIETIHSITYSSDR